MKYFLCLITISCLAGTWSELRAEAPVFQTAEEFIEEAGDDLERLGDVIEIQRRRGAPPTAILEAEIVYFFQTRSFSHAPRLARELEKLARSDDWQQSGFFNSRDSVLGFAALMRARVAMDKGERADFESEIKEAFWKEPQLGSLLAMWIDEVRMQDALAGIRFPLDRELIHSNGETTTIGSLVEENKAVLLDFWATWCGPCIELMPELIVKAEVLAPQGVLVAGMNTENAEKAERFRQEREIPVTWLVEPDDRPFSELLRVDSIPRMVLVDSQGRILFNGHPRDPALNTALAGIGVEL